MRKREWNERLRCNMTFEIRSFQERRLAGTCFRGRDLRRAGNFCRWEHADDLFGDKRFLDRLFERIVRAIRGVDLRDPATITVTVDYGDAVGWASTRPRNPAIAAACETFSPSRRTVALRVKRGELFLAPATSLVTLVIEFGKNRRGLTAVINTIYPGPYVGERRATGPGETEPVNITERENVVFFDWNHDGEQLVP